MPYNKPVKKTRMTPIFRRVGSCSCETATMGKTNMAKSMTRPTTDWGTEMAVEFFASDTSCLRRPGVKKTIEIIAIAP